MHNGQRKHNTTTRKERGVQAGGVHPDRPATSSAQRPSSRQRGKGTNKKPAHAPSPRLAPPAPPPYDCDGQWRYRENCAGLVVVAKNGLGNQLLYVLSAAILAEHLRSSSCSAGPHFCHAYISDFFMYGKHLLPRLRSYLPAIDAAAAPCQLYPVPKMFGNAKQLKVGSTIPAPPLVLDGEAAGKQPAGAVHPPVRWRVGAKVIGSFDNSGGIFGSPVPTAKLRRRLFDEAWASCDVHRATDRAAATGSWPESRNRTDVAAVAVVELHNYCTVAGLTRIREMPASHFWRELRRRAEALGVDALPRDAEAAAARASVDTSSVVCVHLRGRNLECVRSRASIDSPAGRVRAHTLWLSRQR